MTMALRLAGTGEKRCTAEADRSKMHHLLFLQHHRQRCPNSRRDNREAKLNSSDMFDSCQPVFMDSSDFKLKHWSSELDTDKLDIRQRSRSGMPCPKMHRRTASRQQDDCQAANEEGGGRGFFTWCPKGISREEFSESHLHIQAQLNCVARSPDGTCGAAPDGTCGAAPIFPPCSCRQ